MVVMFRSIPLSLVLQIKEDLNPSFLKGWANAKWRETAGVSRAVVVSVTTVVGSALDVSETTVVRRTLDVSETTVVG
jgi:hypothetical protein